MSSGRWSRFGEIALGGLVGLVIGVALEDWLIRERDRFLAWLNPDEIEFSSAPTAVCQTGSIGFLLQNALADGTIREPRTRWEEIARRTLLCARTEPQRSEAVDHLDRLSGMFPGCFDYDADATETLNGGRAIGCFAVRDDDALCQAPIAKVNNIWSRAHDGQGTFFCMGPGAPAAGRTALCKDPEGTPAPRPCTRAELLEIDVRPALVDEVAGHFRP